MKINNIIILGGKYMKKMKSPSAKASAGMAIISASAIAKIFFMFVFLLFVFSRSCRLILFARMLQTIHCRNLFPLKHYFFLYSAKGTKPLSSLSSIF